MTKFEQKLGASLVEAGVVSDDVLQVAIHRQLESGGRLDTNLLELGAVDRDTLMQHLESAAGIPMATLEQVEQIDSGLIRGFPSRLALRYRIIPFLKERKVMHIIVNDPHDLSLIEEIQFLLNMSLKPYVVPEVWLEYALNRYYGIETRARFLELFAKTWGTQSVVAAAPQVSLEQHAEYHRTPVTAPVAAVPPEMAADPVKAPPDEAPEKPAFEAPAKPYTYPRDFAFADLDGAGARDEILWVTLKYFWQHFDLSAVFVVAGGRAKGWRCLGGGAAAEAGVREFSAPLDEPSVFKTTVSSKSQFIGPIASSAVNDQLMAALGGRSSPNALLMPILVKNRVVGAVYSDNGPEVIDGHVVSELITLITHVAASLESLVLRKKAGQTAKKVPAPPKPPASVIEAPPAPVHRAPELPPEPVNEFAPPPQEAAQVEERPVEPTPVDEPPAEAPPAETPPPIPHVVRVEEPKLEEAPTPQPAAPIEERPIEPPPVEEPPADEPPAEEPPAEMPPPIPHVVHVEEPKLEEAPTPQPAAPVEELPVEPPPVEEPPVEEPPAETPPPIPHVVRVEEPKLEEVPTPQELAPAGEARAGEPGPDADEAAIEDMDTALEAAPDEAPAPAAAAISGEIHRDAARTPGKPSAATEAAGAREEEEEHLAATSRSEKVTVDARVVAPGEPTAAASAEALEFERFKREKEIERLYQQIEASGRGVLDDAFSKIADHGEAAVPLLIGKFPGKLRIDPLSQTQRDVAEVEEHSDLVRLLIAIGRPAVEPLCQLTRDPDNNRRFYAVFTFSKLRYPEAIPFLLDRIFDASPKVRLIALDVLSRFRSFPKFAMVTSRLRSEIISADAARQRIAAIALGQFKDAESIPQLIKLVGSRDEDLAEAAVQALIDLTKQNFGDSERKWMSWWRDNKDLPRVRWLIEGLKHKEEDIRFMAIEELRELTGNFFSYFHDAPKKDRDKAVDKWESWFKNDYRPKP